jgi:hypothetical protein
MSASYSICPSSSALLPFTLTLGLSCVKMLILFYPRPLLAMPTTGHWISRSRSADLVTDDMAAIVMIPLNPPKADIIIAHGCDIFWADILHCNAVERWLVRR